MHTKWTVPFLVLVVSAVGALFGPEQAPAVTGGAVDPGNITWLPSATCRVLPAAPG